MKNIPKQLQDPTLRFNLLVHKDKRPLEQWKEKNYPHDDPTLLEHIKNGGNYGVLAGSDLIIIDADTERLNAIVQKELPKTFAVATGKGAHYYYWSPGQKKIVLKDTKGHLGEIQAGGSCYVVGPGSTHPSGKVYTVKNNANITVLSKERLERIIPNQNKKEAPTLISGAQEGNRNESLFRLACTLRRNKVAMQDTLITVQHTNEKNTPPLPGNEILNLVKSAYSYTDEPAPLNEDTKTEALHWLSTQNILGIIDSELDKILVGESENRKAILLNACGKYIKNHQIASYNLCVNSNSGAGKDFTLKKVLSLFPKADVVTRTRISPTAFTYWHNSTFEPEWTWDGKVCLLSDISDGILNHEVFKLMASDGTHSTVVINQRAVDIEIKGKPVLFITTAAGTPNAEMLRRFPILELDESADHTRKIMQRQAELAAKGETAEVNPLIPKALRCLKQVSVKIPYAEVLATPGLFPNSELIMRTHFHRLLDYIKASAGLYQYQRQTDPDGYILAELDDYENALIVLKCTTSNKLMIPLTQKQKKLLVEAEKLSKFRVSEISPYVPEFGLSSLYNTLSTLAKYGFLSVKNQEVDGSNKPVLYYHFNGVELGELPSSAKIKELLQQQKCRISGNTKTKGNIGNRKNNGNKEFPGVFPAYSVFPGTFRPDINPEIKAEILNTLGDSLVTRDELYKRIPHIAFQDIERTADNMLKTGELFEPRQGVLGVPK